MEDTPQLVNVPSYDFISYVGKALDFIILHYPNFLAGVKVVISWLIAISIPVSVFLFIAIIITVERLKMVRRKEAETFDAKIDMGYTPQVVQNNQKGDMEIARKWDKVLQHVESQNPSDWRQAVLEADIILGELLTKLGYKGDGIGEQLRRATKADFATLDSAWDAHKVRNELAHSGSEYQFNQFDARKVIQSYRRVFEEFYYL
jgi:hypothetical protein